MEELISFFKSLLKSDTKFTIVKVYQYDTFPGWPLLAANTRFGQTWDDVSYDFHEEWMEDFEDRFNRFRKNLERVLQNNNLLDNKIGVVIEYNIPGFRTGVHGTLLWCHKDAHDGFFLGCNPNSYVKDNLNIEFKI